MIGFASRRGIDWFGQFNITASLSLSDQSLIRRRLIIWMWSLEGVQKQRKTNHTSELRWNSLSQSAAATATAVNQLKCVSDNKATGGCNGLPKWSGTVQDWVDHNRNYVIGKWTDDNEVTYRHTFRHSSTKSEVHSMPCRRFHKSILEIRGVSAGREKNKTTCNCNHV